MKLVRHRYATAFLAVCYLLRAGNAWAQESAPVFVGRPIVSVEFEPAEQPLDAAVVRETVTVKPGSVYRQTDIRLSIERLYATGRYRDIQVDARASGAGVAIRFITEGTWFVGRVLVETDIAEPPSPAQMVRPGESVRRGAGRSGRREYSEAAARKRVFFCHHFAPTASRFEVPAGDGHLFCEAG